jgi:hypothetical protein
MFNSKSITSSVLNFLGPGSNSFRRAVCAHTVPLIALRIFVLSLLVGAAQICFGQDGNQANKSIQLGSCAGIDLEKDNYIVNSFRVDNPFDFLPWVKIKMNRATEKIAAMIKEDKNKFTYKRTSDKAVEFIEQEDFLPDTSDARVQIRVEFVTVQNCANQHVDVVYRIYSSQIMPVLSSVPEARETEKEAPQTATGQTTVNAPASKPFHFTPTGGYDSTNKLFGGGRLEITRKSPWKFPFDSIIIEGQGSSTMRTISASLAGSTDSSTNWLAHADWLLNYSNFSLPTGTGQLKGGHMNALFSGMSKPLGGGNYTIRFGGSLEGGNRQNSVRDTPLSPDTVANTGYGALKLYAGLDSRLRHNVFSLSYGLELGAVGPAARVDWRKHIADVRHEFWYPVANHHILDLESRFAVGKIQIPGKIPLSERFFGGNNEVLFIPDDSWQIRESPVIRAIPGSRFFRTADGVGGDSFVNYNLTAAYSIWGEPLVPEDVRSDDEVTDLLEGQMNTAENFLTSSYLADDKTIAGIIKQMPTVQSQLGTLRQFVESARAAHPGQFEAEFGACLKAIDDNVGQINSMTTPDSSPPDVLQSLLSTDDSDPSEIQLVKVTSTCKDKLGSLLGDTNVNSTASSFDNLRSNFKKQFDERLAAATRTAKNDMAFPRRTLKTLFNEVNIYSVSPVFVFDIAKIGRESAGLGGVRYGPGAGLRLELANTAHFTLGYAWNVNGGPGEGPGTVFFKIGIRDIFSFR